MKGILFALSFVFIMSGYGIAQKSPVFKTDGKAIRGYDPVAFFTGQKAVAGNEKYTYEWNDATWMFSDKKHLDSFMASPEKYAPQYGGYCAYGASDGEGHKAPTQADTWAIVDGKLYFNYNNKVKEAWSKKTDENIQKADKNWGTLKDRE